ncbi:transglutaminase TgpA family protein [Cognatazoarcus halotolerans]|uniref:transglutaminase TgpA family protein n=1 Tax=Cognatazoarcus halotolerans TaxID=2686016 RepID=UPI00135AAE0A|nr:DUF3488 and transglutaminase-like domain-containing protein [Cognatazoarcus halotolerans]MCB1897981.1 DUF3488 domain-containing transglutaminase family protein [Rhodocyclaceae bacterium]MCP5309614.1 DUF3488 domain-containing transglutaminase family protein [Zoogloeaceae bacterium]
MSKRAHRSPLLTARDGMWLVLTVATTLAPHLGNLPIWLAGVATLLLAARLFVDLHRIPAPGKILLTTMAVAITVLTGVHFGELFGRAPGLALLTAFLGLKLLEARTRRDGLAVVLLCFFMQLGQFLQSQTMNTAVFTMIGVIMATSTLARLHGVANAKGSIRLAILLALQGVPLMLVLFLLFPRIQGPLWGLPGDAFAATTGLSGSMQPGSISNLVRSGEIVFRAEFSGEAPSPRLRYWRGPVLSKFDGRTWTQSNHREAKTPFYRVSGTAYSYTMTLEPNGQRWLLALEVPIGGPDQARYSSDYQLLSERPVTSRIRYSARAYPEARTGAEATEDILQEALALPDSDNPRARRLGQNLRQRHDAPRMRITALLEQFRESALIYTLNPPLLGNNPVDEFLFDTRRGFCEHFASAFVFIARAAGVPARIVTGYQGGEQNPVDHSIVVRQSDAHAWAEVWLKGHGWVRVDPTAESSPSRIDDGIRTALAGEVDLPFVIRADFDWLQAARYRWEAANNAWNQWVLGYDPRRQRLLLNLLGLDSTDWRQLTFVIFLLSLLIVATLMRWVYARPSDCDELDRSWRKLCAILARAGVERMHNEGPLDFSRRAATLRPDLANQLEQIGSLYAFLRYGLRGPDDLQKRTTLKKLVDELGKQ